MFQKRGEEEAVAAMKASADAPAAPAPAPESGTVTKSTEATPLVSAPAAEEDTSLVAQYAAPLAIGFYIFVAITKTMLTKALFNASAAAVAFSSVSAVATCATLVPIFIWDRSAWAVPKSEYVGSFMLVCVLVALDLAFTNWAISLLALALQQCILATNPAFCIVIESIYRRKLQHSFVYLVIAVLCAGPIVANVYGVAALDASYTLGITVQIAGVFCSAMKYVFAHAVMSQTKKDLGTFAFLFWTDVFILPILVPWALLVGDFPILFGGVTSVAAGFNLFLTAVLGGVRFFSQLLVLRTSTATTLSCANLAYQAGNIYLSLLIFGEPPLTLGLIGGSVITLTGAGTYVWLKTSKILTKNQKLIEIDNAIKATVCPCAAPPPLLDEKPAEKKLVEP